MPMKYLPNFIQYLRLEKRYADHTLKAYETDLQQLSNYLTHTYNDPVLTDSPEALMPYHVKSWLVALIEQGTARRSVARKLAALKSYYQFLNRRSYTDHNPAANLTAPKFARHLSGFVETNPMLHLLQQLPFSDDFAGKRDAIAIELLYATGLRSAELLSLCDQMLNFANNTLKIVGKGTKQRVIPLLPHTIQRLQQYISLRNNTFPELAAADNPPLLITDKGKAMYPRLLHRIVTRYLALATTAEYRGPHLLRHTFATQLLNEGADLNAIKDLLGHSNLAATQHYTHNTIEKIRQQYAQAHPKANTS
jgi:integrase/recombinase XerC